MRMRIQRGFSAFPGLFALSLLLTLSSGCPDSGDDDDSSDTPGSSPTAPPPLADADEDGYTAEGEGGDDCDDANASIHPGAEELCDEIDNNCDDQIDEGVTDTFYPDDDGDGYGDPEAPGEACAAPDGHVDNGDDCDDGEASINPDAAEACDEADNDCDGEIDESSGTTVYLDLDEDGFGDPDEPVTACGGSQPTALDGSDCDDSRADVNPDAAEVCDEADNDCDEEIDEEGLTDWYPDADGDGYGAGDPEAACGQPDGTAARDGDCDDSRDDVNPEAIEACDEVDNDCDEAVDEEGASPWYPDGDGDGHGAGEAIEACGQPEGHVSSSDDCDDSRADIHPEAIEACDGADNDCDDAVDEDGQSAWYADQDDDGYGAGQEVLACSQPADYVAQAGDCDDTDPESYPGADELCDEADNDCDVSIDEDAVDATAWYEDQDQDLYGASSTAVIACDPPEGYVDLDGDCDDEEPEANPGELEVCDGIDNDCDRAADEGAADAEPWYADDDGDGRGDPNDLVTACDPPTGYIATAGDCNDQEPRAWTGAAETPDGVDNDCDGVTDEGTEAYDDDGDGYTETQGDCNDADPAIHPGATEVPDGVDNDCDNQVDDGTTASDDDGDGASETEGDCDDTDPDDAPGTTDCPWTLGGSSCAELNYAGKARGDGLYVIDPDGSGGVASFTVYCDMTTDGGGWTLLGTISGADENRWNTQFGLWSDKTLTGTLEHALDRDYKSPAWYDLNVKSSQVLFRRSYDRWVRGQVVLGSDCLRGKERFNTLFSVYDTQLACTNASIRVLHGSDLGLAKDYDYSEGDKHGLGGTGANGFCWNGEDTESNRFQGHLVWSWQSDAGSDKGCSTTGHLGGAGVFYTASSQFTTADITGTNWLYGTDYKKTSISLFVRGPNPADKDLDGYTTAQGDCDDSSATVKPGSAGCAWDVGGRDCAEIKRRGLSKGSGVYKVDPDGAGSVSPFDVLCDMTTDGGGWTLLGTIAGRDTNRWHTENGAWNDDSTMGSLSDPLDADYKSAAWSTLDIKGGEVLWQRRYDKVDRGRVVVTKPCLGSKTRFKEFFATFDTAQACAADKLRVLEGSTTGVASSEYAEGAASGLGGSSTNGFCWNIEDTDTNVFRGRVGWNQYPGNNCKQTGHLGGIGVFWENHTQFEVADITGTNWINGTDLTKSTVSLWVRTPSSGDADGDGYSAAEGDCNDSSTSVYAGASSCPWNLGGRSCWEVRRAGKSRGDGFYTIDPDGTGSADGFAVWCDMTTDGGGWTLLGTVSGVDSNVWNTENGHWNSPGSVVGSLSVALTNDFKSLAWNVLDVSDAEVLWQRRYSGTSRGKSVLNNFCMDGRDRFYKHFTTFDTDRACEPEDVWTLQTSNTGVGAAEYAEGASSGLGGSGSNGFCWNIEDTDTNVFRGRLGWNQYPGSTTCKREGHLGGVGVFWENDSQYTVADITGTNWLSGTNLTQTAISLFVRDFVEWTNPFDRDGDGQGEADGDCDDRDPDVYAGHHSCPWNVGGSSCLDILSAGDDQGDGVYYIDPDGSGIEVPFAVWCDMTTDGGGWTLLGTVAGADTNRWNVEKGIWADESVTGSLLEPWDTDFKSPAWYALDISGGEVLFQRRYSGTTRGQVVLKSPCVGSVAYFNDLFGTFNTNLACAPKDMKVVKSSSTGVADSSYAEGASNGLAGSGTNGFCWGIEDTDSNVFRGHLGWNQYPGSTTCKREGHLGGVGVFWENDSQYTVADITGTNWLYGTTLTATSINLFVR